MAHPQIGEGILDLARQVPGSFLAAVAQLARPTAELSHGLVQPFFQISQATVVIFQLRQPRLEFSELFQHAIKASTVPFFQKVEFPEAFLYLLESLGLKRDSSAVLAHKASQLVHHDACTLQLLQVGPLPGQVHNLLQSGSEIHGRPISEDLTGPVWATANDPRITRVGKILRATALDELLLALEELELEEGPLVIQVDAGRAGEKIEVSLG
jgi:hypothetical protein